jgi:flagellar hook-length control protein FliK
MTTIASLLVGLTERPATETPIQPADGQTAPAGATQGLASLEGSFQTVLIGQLGGANSLQSELSGPLTIRLVPADPVLPSLADLGKMAGSHVLPSVALPFGKNTQTSQMNVIARFSIPTSTGKTVPAQIANDCKPATDAKTTQPLSVAEVLVATVPVAAAKQSETKLMRSSHSVEEGSPQKTKADGTKTIEAAEAKNDVPAILQGTPVSPVLSTNQETAAVVSGMVLAMVVASKSKDSAAPVSGEGEKNGPGATQQTGGRTKSIRPEITKSAVETAPALSALAGKNSPEESGSTAASKAAGTGDGRNTGTQSQPQIPVVLQVKGELQTADATSGISSVQAERLMKNAHSDAGRQYVLTETVRSQTAAPLPAPARNASTIASALKNQMPEMDELNIRTIDTVLQGNSATNVSETSAKTTTPQATISSSDSMPISSSLKEVKRNQASTPANAVPNTQSDAEPATIVKRPVNGVSFAPENKDSQKTAAVDVISERKTDTAARAAAPFPEGPKDAGLKDTIAVEVRSVKSGKANTTNKMPEPEKRIPAERPIETSRPSDSGTRQDEGRQAAKEQTPVVKEELWNTQSHEQMTPAATEGKTAAATPRPSASQQTIPSGTGSQSADPMTAAHAVKQTLTTPPQEVRTERTIVATLKTLPDAIVQEVTKSVPGGAKETATEIRITLKPESLGEIVVKVNMEDGKVKAEIEVANSTVRNVLEANMPALRDTLIARGIDIQKIDVLTEGEGGSRNTAGQQEPGQKHRNDHKGFTLAEKYAAERNMGYNTIELTI